jgi:adenylyltransferase/sulfurtransferase
MKEIDVQELLAWREETKAHQLIDIREAYEFEMGNLGGIHIPMGHIFDRLSELSRDIPVVLQCRSGGRSAAVLTALEDRYGMDNLYNLKGGAQAWAAEVDPTVEVA